MPITVLTSFTTWNYEVEIRTGTLLLSIIDYKQCVEYIQYIAEAHQAKVLPTAKALRVFPSGEKNPYFTHSLWCSSMLLLETQLPERIRDDVAIALLVLLGKSFTQKYRAMIANGTLPKLPSELKEA